MKRSILLIFTMLVSLSANAAPAIGTFTIPSDYSSRYPTYFRPVPTWVDQVSLDGTNNTNYTVPSGAGAIIIGTNCTHFYVKFGGSAVVPAAGATDGTGSSADPVAFVVTPGEIIGFISNAACYVTLDVYKLN